MLQLLSGWFRPQPYLKLLMAALLIPSITVTSLQPSLAQSIENAIAPLSLKSSPPIEEPSAPTDPLASPHPVPWTWVMKTYEDVSSQHGSGVRYYRSHSLISPDGEYAAYSRIQMQVQPELYHSRVSSVMFLENLRTRQLQEIKASSPLAMHLVVAGEAASPGIISILTPVGWSKSSDRLLARQFEGIFSSSDASDYAVIWRKQDNRTTTVAPVQSQSGHATSILLGWSQAEPAKVVFRAGDLGDEQWHTWIVAENGQTKLATNIEQPIVFGQQQMQLWTGEQIAYR